MKITNNLEICGEGIFGTIAALRTAPLLPSRLHFPDIYTTTERILGLMDLIKNLIKITTNYRHWGCQRPLRDRKVIYLALPPFYQSWTLLKIGLLDFEILGLVSRSLKIIKNKEKSIGKICRFFGKFTKRAKQAYSWFMKYWGGYLLSS